MAIVNLVVGFALLTMGRRLFWFFVAAIGFWLGFSVGVQLLPAQSETIAIVLGLISGLAGMLLARFVQRLAITFSGFAAGGYLLVTIWHWFTADSNWLQSVILFVIGGVIGAALMGALFNWALIGLSATIGAILIVELLPGAPGEKLLLFGILLLGGVLIQNRLLRSTPPKSILP